MVQIEQLRQENIQLKNDIKEMRNYIQDSDYLEKVYGYDYPRGGYYGRMRNIPQFDSYWKDTVFWKHRQNIDNRRNLPLDIMEEGLSNYRSMENAELYPMFTCTVVAYCDMVLPTEKGPILSLIDPFGERKIVGHALDNIKAQSYIDRLLRLDCMEKPNSGNLQIMNIEKLPYNLFEKL